MVSNSVVKKDNLTVTFVSETGHFQNLYRLVLYFRISSRRSVDTTIQQMIKFDVLSAFFVFLFTLFCSFKGSYKKEIYSFLIGQNLPGITNLAQKTFQNTSKSVVSLQSEHFLKEFQPYFDTNFIEHTFTNFNQNNAIKLKKKETLFKTSNMLTFGETESKENSLFNGKVIANPYYVYVKSHNNFEKNGIFLPLIYDQTKFLNKKKTKTPFCNLNLSSPYHLAFQSCTAKDFVLSTIKKLEKESTYLKFSELSLKSGSYFGIFQKKDVTTKLNGGRQNIFKFPQKKHFGVSARTPTTSPLQNKIHNKSQLFLANVENQNWVRPYKQNEIITKNLSQKDSKNWFYLTQKTSLSLPKNISCIFSQNVKKSTENQFAIRLWFSLYKNNLLKKNCDYLRKQSDWEKLEAQPLLLNKLFFSFYNVNNLSKPHGLSSTIVNNTNLVNLGNFVKQDVSNTKKPSFSSINWWNLIFNGDFSLNSNFIIENKDFPFLSFHEVKTKFSVGKPQLTKGSVFVKQKEEAPLKRGKSKFLYKKFRLDQKWKEKNYHNYSRLDEFPSKLGSILPSEILVNQFSTKIRDQILDSTQKRKESFVIKQKFILRGSKSTLNFSESGFTKKKNLNPQSQFTLPHNSSFYENFAVSDSKLKQSQGAKNSSLKRKETQLNAFYLVLKSPKLRLLTKEIKAIFSSSKNNSFFLEKEKKTFNLLSNKLLTLLDHILLDSSHFLQSKDQVSQSEILNTLFEFLPQKDYSTSHEILQNISENDKILFCKNDVKQNVEDILSLTQENSDLTNFSAKLKKKGNLKLKHTKKFTQLLQDFWSKEEEGSHKETLDFSMQNLIFAKHEIRKDFTGKIKNNWFTFFIKYLSTQPRLMSGYQFPDLNTGEIEKFIKYSDSKKVLINKIHFLRKISFFIGHFGKNRISKFQKDKCFIFPQISKKEICQQPFTNVYLPNGLFFSNLKNKVYQTKCKTSLSLLSQPIVSQTPIISSDQGFSEASFGQSPKQEAPYLKSLRFISKSLKLENNTEKQSFFVYQAPAVLKMPSIWNPRLQKLQIGKTINKFKYPASYTGFSKNTLSSTNFLTDRKQHFFATGNQIEKQQENSFIQRPLSGSVFGLSSNHLGNKIQKNLYNKSLLNAKLQAKDLTNAKIPFDKDKENLVFREQELKEKGQNLNLIKKDFSILPLPSKSIPFLLDKNSFKPINGINSYPFFDVSAFHSLKAVNLHKKTDAFLNNCLSNCETFTDLTQNDLKFYRLPLTKKILENSKLNIKRKQLSDKCDKQINTLQSVLPFLEVTDFTKFWTKWLSSRYKKPAISYRFQKKVFYLPFDEKVDFFLQQKNRYQKNKWGEVEQQENRSKNVETSPEAFKDFSEQFYLPLTIKRSLYFPNRLKILPNKNAPFSFFTTKPLSLQNKNDKLKELSLNNSQKKGQTFILPYKKLSFVPKIVWQEQEISDTFSRKNTKGDHSCLVGTKESSATQIAPLSYFLFDTVEKSQTFLSYLKRFDSNYDRLDWQFSQWIKDQFTEHIASQDISEWYPFLNEKYAYLPPSQSILNEEFLNSLFKNKIKKRNTVYKYSRNFPILKSHYVKSERLKNLLSKISTLQSASFPEKTKNVQKQVLLAKNDFAIKKRNEILKPFKKIYSFSRLQKKESFLTLFFPKKKRIDICWEPITIKSWMVITQYCYAFFLVQSALYVYEKHMKKVLLSFAPLLSGRGILSGMPSFGEKLQDFLGGSTIDKNVLLFKKVPKKFQDIVAIDNKLPQLSEIVWFLRNFGRTANVNKIQGVLFVGPPGTGKTLLVQAIAGEAEVPVLVLSGSSFADGKKDKKGGQLLKRVFQRARILAPSILFIDEIDTLGESRSHFAQDDRDQKNESSRIIESISHIEEKIHSKTDFSKNLKNQSVKQVGLLTQFLVEMDGLARQQKNSYFFNNKIAFKKLGGILVIGSTNRPKVLDPALTRPGRFDQIFYLSNPGKQRRIEILKVYTKNIGVSTCLPWNYLADRTLGFSAADLSAIVNRSTIQAILSHTLHTIQSIENGIESLPKLSQNQNKLFIWQENQISNSFLFLELQKYHNQNKTLCESVSTSLLTCAKYLSLQNKNISPNFWTDQVKKNKNAVLELLEKSTTPSKSADLEKFKENFPQSFSDFNLQENKTDLKPDYSLDVPNDKIRAKSNGTTTSLGKGLYFDKQNNDKENFAFTKQNIKAGMSFLKRLPFYQAGKIMSQILLFKASSKLTFFESKDSMEAKPQLISNLIDRKSVGLHFAEQNVLPPTVLVATLWPKQELSFSNMFKESINVKEVTSRSQLETRLISGYAGKAAETLLISGLQFSENSETKITWQSTLGIEEWKLTNSLSYLMISKYCFYSQKGTIRKENLIALSQNSNEILETDNFKILQNIFFKEESTFSQEKQHFDLSESQNYAIKENEPLLNPIIWISSLDQQYKINKIFGQIEENNWYQIYLPPLVKDEQNKEWVPLDQYYFGRENLIELVWNTCKKKSTNWCDIYQLDYDLTYQGLILHHFNKALSLLDKNRELLDLFANLLISFHTIRRHEILRIFSYFKY